MTENGPQSATGSPQPQPPTTATTSPTSTPPSPSQSSGGEAARVAKPTNDLHYMHRPPRIVPNYGRKPRGTLPKSNISRVLLYDNVTQQQMLDVKISHLTTEQRKSNRLMDMHRKSFIVRRMQKQRQAAGMLLHVDHTLPELPVVAPSNRQADVPAAVAWVEEGDEAAADGAGDVLPALASIPNPSPAPGGPGGGRGRPRQGALSLHREVQGPGRDPGAWQGLTRLVHTFHEQAPPPRGLGRPVHTSMEPGGWAASGPPPPHWLFGGQGRGRTTEDLRYRRLERRLVRVDPPNEGFLELSPSFHAPRQTVAFTRPSSFATRPSSFASRRSSLASRPSGLSSRRSSFPSRPSSIGVRPSLTRPPPFVAAST